MQVHKLSVFNTAVSLFLRNWVIVAVPKRFSNDMRKATDVMILNSKQAFTQLCV